MRKPGASQVSINVANDDELLYWAAKSGAKAFFVGMESLNQEVLNRMGKYVNLKAGIQNYKEIIRKIHDYGIAVVGAFVLGNDEDDGDVFKRTTEFVLASGLDGTQYTIATPLPGTRLFERLSKEGRILYNNFPSDWGYFDTFHVTFMPKRFDPDELEEEVSKMYRLTNRPLIAARRSLKTLAVTRYLKGVAYVFGFNVGYWKGYRRVR